MLDMFSERSCPDALTKTETRPGGLLPRVSLALRMALMATIMLIAQVGNDNHVGKQ